jgi:hypothetical protein
VEDTTILIVSDLRISVKSHFGSELLTSTGSNHNFLTDLKISLSEVNSEGL